MWKTVGTVENRDEMVSSVFATGEFLMKRKMKNVFISNTTFEYSNNIGCTFFLY